MVLKYAEIMKIVIFHKHILNMDNLLIIRFTCNKNAIQVCKTNLLGIVSQNVCIGLSYKINSI